jgi:nicotinamidase-related amidase
MRSANGIQIPTGLSDVCDPRRMALVVYDMQVGIVRQLNEPEGVIRRIQQVIGCARAAGMRIIYLRHLSMPKALMGAFQFRTAMAWQRTDSPNQVAPWFLRDAPGFQIIPELQPTGDDGVLDKITMSAFKGTPLEIVLRDCGLCACAIVGAAIEIGIEPTVRQAADLGIVPVLVRDACAAGDADAGVRALASMAFMGDAMFTDTDTFCRILTACGRVIIALSPSRKTSRAAAPGAAVHSRAGEHRGCASSRRQQRHRPDGGAEEEPRASNPTGASRKDRTSQK